MKKLRRPRRHRLWRILEMIREGTRTGNLPSSRDFQRELEVCRRTLCSDLDCLRDDENAPIEYDSRKHGYYLADATWQLPDMRVSRGEAFAFLVALRALEAFRGTPVETDMRAVMERIGSLLEGKVPVQTAFLMDHLTVFASDYVPQDAEIWRVVAEVIVARERIEAVYTPLYGETVTLLLDLHHMVAYRGSWYVLARGGANGDVLTLALSRLKDVRPTGARFERAADFDPQACFFEGLGFADADDGSEVRLLCSRDIATYIAERIWHPSQTCIPRDDGSLELRFQSTGGIEIEKLVLSWQPHIEVLAPSDLRSRVALALQAGLAVHGL